MSTQNEFYNRFFKKGGWQYDLAKERANIRNVLAPLGRWERGHRLVEVGAGMCHQAECVRQLGLDVTAVEASKEGADFGRRQYPDVHVVCQDAASWNPSAPVDHVYARGMSFFHYELGGVNCRGIDVPKETGHMFSWLKSGGTFLLQIVTDFSGKKSTVHQNRLEDYRSLFERFGEVVSVTDFSGKSVPRASHDRGVVVVTKKR